MGLSRMPRSLGLMSRKMGLMSRKMELSKIEMFNFIGDEREVAEV